MFLKIRALSVVSTLAVGSFSIPVLYAAPEGFQCVHGEAKIVEAANGSTTVQTQGRAVIHWDKFSIGSHEQVVFHQAGMERAVLNRVIGKSSSELLGALLSNGNVYLINPQGVLIGPGARIETHGFLASTLDVLDADFLKGKEMIFIDQIGDGTIVHHGSIHCPSGDVFLFAAHIDNQGKIHAPQGDVGIAAAAEVLLSVEGKQRIFIRPKQSFEGSISHSGQIEAIAIELQSQGSPYASAIRSSGEIDALTVAESGGRVLLRADHGILEVDGKINGQEIYATADDVYLLDEARLDASGRRGGKIFIGGGVQGEESEISPAQRTYVASGARLIADASDAEGGTVVVWSNEKTYFGGRISARGKTSGGFVEVSGNALKFLGEVDLHTDAGAKGTLLLDPHNIQVIAGGSAFAAPYTFATTPAVDVTIDNVSLAGAINGGAAVLLQSNTDTTFSSPVTLTAPTGSLTVNAGRRIIFDPGVALTLDTAPFTATINDVGAVPANRDAGNAFFFMDTGSSITSSTGAINVSFGTFTGGLVGEGFINIDGGAISSTSGPITLAGQGYGALNALPDNCGITIQGAAQVSSGGPITLTGAAGAATATPAHGIYVDNSTLIQVTGSGDLNMTGSVPAANTAGASTGIRVVSGTTAIIESTNTASGDIIMTGSSAASDLAAGANAGLDLNEIIRSLGTGAITLMGTGSPNSAGNSNAGVALSSGAEISSVAGDITITGVRGGSGAAGTTAGVALRGNVEITATNDANITINANTGTNPSGQQSMGFSASSLGLQLLISAENGDIVINGTGSSGGGAVIANHGVHLLNASLASGGGVITTGSGNIQITGLATSGNASVGIEMENSSIQALGSGDITLAGTSTTGGFGQANSGVKFTLTSLITNVIRAQNGNISITGTGGGGPGSQENAGIYVSGSAIVGPQRAIIETLGPGQITLVGTSNAHSSTSGNNGVMLDLRTIVRSTGASPAAGPISITGTANSGLSNNNGVAIADSTFASGIGGQVQSLDGPITIEGQGGGNGTGNNGVLVTFAGDVISTGLATIDIEGTGGVGSTDNNGVHVTETGSSITSSGTGAATIVGQGGPGGALAASRNHGVRVSDLGVITSTAGHLMITGTGGGNALGINNTGVFVDTSGDVIATGTAPLTVDGTGGNGITAGHGIQVTDNGSSITTSSSGPAVINGMGSTAASAIGLNNGIQVDNLGLIQGSVGTVDITGTGGGNGTGPNNVGVAVISGDILATGTATMDVSGTGGNGPLLNLGVLVTGAGATIETTSSNPMNISGLGGGNGTGIDNVGVFVAADGDILMSGSGPLNVLGTGGNGTTANCGVRVTGSGSTIFSSGGTSLLTITGNGSTAAAATSSNHGIEINIDGMIGTTGADVRIIGTGGGNGLGDTNVGVELITGGQIMSSSPGGLIIEGTGGNGTGSNYGVRTADVNTGVTSANGGLIQITGSHGAATLEDVVIETQGVVGSNTTGAIEIDALLGDVLIQDGGSIISVDSGPVAVQALNDVRLQGGKGIGAYARIMPTNGNATIEALQGDVSLIGGSGTGSYVQIGNDATAGLPASAALMFVRAAGDVIVDGTDTNSYALIGHGNPSAPNPLDLTTDIQVFATDVIVNGANAGAGAQGFGQIGHVGSLTTSMNLGGDIYVDARNDILITGGSAASSAYARIGHGGQLGPAPVVTGNMLLIADVDILMSGNPTAQAQIENLGPGTVTCVVDDLFPVGPCVFGPGRFEINTDSLISTGGGELRIYTVSPSQNVIDAPLNGTVYVAGPFNVNSATETWSTYYPSGTYGGDSYNLYYKVPCIADEPGVDMAPVYQLAIDNSQLTVLLPNYLPFNYENYPYHPKICIYDWAEERLSFTRGFPKVTDIDCEPTFIRFPSKMFENFLR